MSQPPVFKQLNPNAQRAKVLADVLFYCTTLEQECTPSDILCHVMTINNAEEEEVGSEVYASLFALTRCGTLMTNTLGTIGAESTFKGHPLLLQMIHHGAWDPETFEDDEV